MRPAKQNQVLIRSDDAALLGALRPALEAAGLDAGATDEGGAFAVVLDARGERAAAAEQALATGAPKTILLVDSDDKDNINRLLARYEVSHLIGANGRAPVKEIVTTLAKERGGAIFGLEPYFGPGATPEKRTISDAASIKETISSLLDALDLETSFEATYEFLTLTANELVTNAVYNAPVDDGGKPKYEQTDRRVKVKLEPQETVEIAVCESEHEVGIAVTDRFGRLTRDKIVRHLVKCVNNTAFIEEKKGGAGAGIYLAFHTASQFVVNIEPGKRLEMLCILEKNKRYKDYRSRVTSFNIFTVPQRAVMGGAA